MEGVNDLSVTCLIVSKEDITTSLTVRVGPEKNVSMITSLISHQTSKVEYEEDNRYVLEVKPDTTVVTGVRFTLLYIDCVTLPVSHLPGL